MKEPVNLKNNTKTVKITLKAVYIKKLNQEFPSTIISNHFINSWTIIIDSDQVADYNKSKPHSEMIKKQKNKIKL